MTKEVFDALFDEDGNVVVAIWTGDDDAPRDDPLGHLDQVSFHNRLRYPAIIAEHSGTLSLPSRAASTIGWQAHNLFAHGRTGTPLVLGYVVASGERRRIAGSWPAQRHARGWARWLSVGADDTNVRMAESWFAAHADFGGAYSAIDIDWVVYVLETTFGDTPSPTEYLDISDDRFEAGDFDSRKRYLRAGSTLSNFPIVRGRTMGRSIFTPTNYPIVAPTYSLDGDTHRTNYVFGSTTVIGPNFAADFELVTT